MTGESQVGGFNGRTNAGDVTTGRLNLLDRTLSPDVLNRVAGCSLPR